MRSTHHTARHDANKRGRKIDAACLETESHRRISKHTLDKNRASKAATNLAKASRGSMCRPLILLPSP